MESVERIARQKTFWNEKAKTFPRYEEGDETYEAGVLDLVRGHGVDIRGKTVLDVGCGSGMYTIRLAKEAARVTAVDISETMLAILREDAEKLGVDNIDYVLSDWMDFESDAVFDVVFCSMTPAIESEESKLKLLGHARGATIFMGFAGVMRSDVLAGLYEHYGVTPKIFNNGPEMRGWLDDKGIAHAAYPVEGQWVVAKSREELMDSCSSMLIPYSVTPDQDHLRQYVEQFREGPDKYVERTDYKIELIIWES